MAAAVPVLQPRSIQVGHLDQVALPVASALGKAWLVFVSISFFAATFAAAAESACDHGIRSAAHNVGAGATIMSAGSCGPLDRRGAKSYW
jgi:hypothetical protein